MAQRLPWALQVTSDQACYEQWSGSVFSVFVERDEDGEFDEVQECAGRHATALFDFVVRVTFQNGGSCLCRRVIRVAWLSDHTGTAGTDWGTAAALDAFGHRTSEYVLPTSKLVATK